MSTIPGLLGAFGTAAYLSKTKKYKLSGFVVCLGSTISMAAFAGSLLTESIWIVSIACGIMAVFIMSMLAVGLDFGCEVTYPVPANNASGVMISYSQLIAGLQLVVASLVLTTPEEEKDAELYERKIEGMIVTVMFIACCAAAMICATFAKQDLRKTRMDTEGKENMIDT